MEADDEALMGMLRRAMEDSGVFVPVIAWQPQDGPMVLACVAGDGGLDDMVGDALPRLRRDFGDPSWFAVASDTYGRDAEDPDEPLPPGGLGMAFMMGDPRVTEQLVLLVAEPGLGVRGMRQRYRHIPSEGWEWDEPEPFSDTTTALEAVMRSNI